MQQKKKNNSVCQKMLMKTKEKAKMEFGKGRQKKKYEDNNNNKKKKEKKKKKKEEEKKKKKKKTK